MTKLTVEEIAKRLYCYTQNNGKLDSLYEIQEALLSFAAQEAADKDARIAELEAELLRLRKIAKDCIEDDEENELSVELNRVGEWMMKFLDGGKFPS